MLVLPEPGERGGSITDVIASSESAMWPPCELNAPVVSTHMYVKSSPFSSIEPVPSRTKSNSGQSVLWEKGCHEARISMSSSSPASAFGAYIISKIFDENVDNIRRRHHVTITHLQLKLVFAGDIPLKTGIGLSRIRDRRRCYAGITWCIE